MMLLVALLSFGTGYFLNEEKALERLCKNLGYTHEGWLVLHDQRGFFIYFIFVILSFLKGWFWSIVFQNFFCFSFILIILYVYGNFIAVGDRKRFHFSYWCTLAGILLGINKVYFQFFLTVIVVSHLLRCH